MNDTKDRFSIDIVLRHPSYSPERISEALSMKPQGSHDVGEKHGGSTAQWTFFFASLQKGDGHSEYETALNSVAQFLEKHAAFWNDFTAGRGELELILNHTFLEGAEAGDLCLKLSLEPRFLAQLSKRGFGLRIQAWKGQLNTRNLSVPPRQGVG
jgi:hypothetical protein